jgi:diguanylate cyclase (GGDEF)-like protein
VDQFQLSQLPLLEIGIGAGLALLLALFYFLGRQSSRPKRIPTTTGRMRLPDQGPGGDPVRRLEQDIAYLVGFIKEFPTLMSELHSQTEVRQIPVVILNSMVRIFRPEQTVVLVRRKGTLMEPERSGRLIVAAVSSGERGLDVGTEIPIGDGQLGVVARTQRVMDRADFDQMTDHDHSVFKGPNLPIFEVAAPMVHGTETLGVIALSRPQRHHPHEKEMLQIIAQMGALTWNNLAAYRNVKVAADVDELTGIFNKRALKFRLSELVYEARQNGSRASVFLFDIDHFKNYNDHNGHIAGDQALRLLAQLVRDTVRADDIFGRFGGEEFLLIMPGRTAAQAMSAAGNIRQRIAHYEFPFGEHQPMGRVTVSGGVATFPDDSQDAVEMLMAADSALYRAKQQGRNKVFRAEGGVNPMSVVPKVVNLDDDSAH